MSDFNVLLVVIMLLVLPISIYLNFVSYLKTMNIEEKKYYLDFALLTSLFLLIKFDFYSDFYIILFFNIPLLLAFIKNRKFSIFIMVPALFWFYYNYLSYNPVLLFLEYLFYILFYFWCLYKKKSLSNVITMFVVVESFTMGFLYFYTSRLGILEIDSFFFLAFIIVLFVIVTYSIIYIFRLADKVSETNSILVELKREKDLRLSLFKIAHEVKNPLAVCKGYLSMISKKNVSNSFKYIDIIKKEVDKTLLIIDDFSEFGKIKLENEIIDICYLVEEVVGTLGPMFKGYDSKVNCSSLDDEVYIEGDYNRIKQVLVNIFKNSLEAKGMNKLIIDVKFKIDNIGYINIIIKDNGLGMSRENLAKISEPFFSTKENGTGLGVALSKEIIELHGGSIRYKSILDKGTTVIVSLPLK